MKSILIPPSVVEINTGLICGCTPILKPFFRHVLSRRPKNPPQRMHFTKTGSVWVGKDPEDETRWNYRCIVELERGHRSVGRPVVHELEF